MLFRLMMLIAHWADSFSPYDGEDHRRLPSKSYPEFLARVSRGEFLQALREARVHDFFAEDVPPDPARLREVLAVLAAETAKLPALSEYSKRLERIPATADQQSVLRENGSIWDDMLRHLDHLAREQEDEKKRQAPARRDAHVKKARSTSPPLASRRRATSSSRRPRSIRR